MSHLGREVAERLLEKVEEGDNGCLIWKGGKSGIAYGALYFQGRNHKAHRLAYEIFVGPIPDGLQLDHLCRNTMCVNPAHLEPVTQRENVLRGVSIVPQNAAKTHCPQGHPYNAENTVLELGKWRRCLICRREKGRRYDQRKRAAA